MDQYDKLFNQIKEASKKTEVQDFPAMDKVWSRVEDKLDNKVLKKENNLWKKIAVAASFLLVFTVGYQIFKPKNQIVTEAEIVLRDTVVETQEPIQTEEALETPITNPLIKEDAPVILKNQIKAASEVVLNDNIVVPAAVADAVVATESETKDQTSKSFGYSTRNSGEFLKSKKSEAVSVRRSMDDADNIQKEVSAAPQKTEPLVVIDGKPIAGKNRNKTNMAEIEDIVVLKEPLYIINGVHYSEQELFGPNPTSPYTPLNQQEIESLSILQNEKAIEAYGEKGRKGVVIITTKNGKPISAESGK